VITAKVRIDTSGFGFVVAQNRKRGVTQKGARAGGKVLERAVKSAAPKRKGSGALRVAQGIKVGKGKSGSTTAFAVQGSKKKYSKMAKFPRSKKPVKVVPHLYDHLVQGGTRPHSLKKGSKSNRRRLVPAGLLRFGRMLLSKVSKVKGHPGAKPNPFRKRALSSAKHRIRGAILDAMAEEQRKLIARAAAKLGA